MGHPAYSNPLICRVSNVGDSVHFAPDTENPVKRLLTVDDSKAVRDIIRSLLEHQQGLIICGEATDGLDAIEKAKELQPDVILLDLVMPKLNGAEATSALKRAVPGVRIVLFTLYEDAANSLAPAVGVDVVLSKPDGVHHLLKHLNRLFDSKWSH
jgi:two-component system, chemotaxis family, chemotaxis protein CheY